VRRALSFLTVLGRAGVPDQRTLTWFPVVGAGVGAIVGFVWWGAGRVWPAALAATLAVAADAAVTGGLHLDGLADAADGLLPPVDRQRRLEIMADPRVGAFGAVTLVVVLLVRVTALASTPARPLVVVALWCGSRTLMAVAARAVPYAHAEGGTAAAFTGATARSPHEAAERARRPGWAAVGAYGMAATVALAVLGVGVRGVVIVACEVLAMAAVVWLAWRRIGGYTGDVLGAGGVVAETVGLLVLAAR
jgi:adenosylcobinamide-GDP ribazoletransferase